jgi:hypothetical protein
MTSLYGYNTRDMLQNIIKQNIIEKRNNITLALLCGLILACYKYTIVTLIAFLTMLAPSLIII